MMTRRRSLLLGMLAGPAWAQRFDQVPAPGPAVVPPLPRLRLRRLANGLRLLIAPRPGWPLLTARLLLDGGSLLDPPAKAGQAQLLLDLLSRGARRGGELVDASDIAFAAESLGAPLESELGPLGASLGLSLMAEQLDAGLALLADLVRAPSLAQAELERCRAEALEERALDLADPGALARLLARRLHWGESPAGRVATPASLARVRRPDLLAAWRRLRPDSSWLLLAGEVEEGEAVALAEAHFGGWRGSGPTPPRPAPVPARPLAVRRLLVDLPGAGQSAVLLSAPHAGLDDAPALQLQGLLANAVLGQGYSARLGQEVRIRRGLSYGATSQVESLPGGGWLSAFAQTRHDKAAEVAALMSETLQRLGMEPVGAAELAARRASLLGELARQQDSGAGLVTQLAEQLQQGRDPQALAELPAQLAAVDAEQLRGFAARFWPAPAQRLVVVGDLRAAGFPTGPQEWRLRAAELDLERPDLRRRL